ncbi:hypothetical protein GO730_38870 [Spirosoma sp. HMF3257]|uniref:Uncharacterized protein n=1 Tax=Spirosoma telluris TaxID=2183553 RepID=A0A327NFX7_9BACT|nr:hypothetical protein [Spirosoma telluris]RAI72866.1 hypothetical protein HMF3257_38800 [Spirosoma telluris]
MEHYTLDFKAPNGFPSSADVTIYRDIQLVVVSETGKGMSVTNAAEVIATEIVNRYGLDPDRMLFIEHYSDEQRTKPYGESYDLVTFTWDGLRAHNPEWRHLPLAEFNEILNTVKSEWN